MCSEQMEIIGSCCRIANLHVDFLQNVKVVVIFTVFWDEFILVTEDQVSFSSAWGVLWALTIIAVWQKHNEAILDVPFGFSTTYELINNNLGTICKITELSFPQSEGIWMCLRIAKFVSEYSKLWKMRVGGDELSLRALIMYNTVDRVIVPFFILVENVGMSVTKCTSFNILTWNSHMETFLDKRGESKGFSGTPIDSFFVSDGFSPLLENLSNKPMEVFISWQMRNLGTDVFK